jgi:hypothetical protein
VDVTAEEGIKGSVPPPDEMELLGIRPIKVEFGNDWTRVVRGRAIELVEG